MGEARRAEGCERKERGREGGRGWQRWCATREWRPTTRGRKTHSPPNLPPITPPCTTGLHPAGGNESSIKRRYQCVTSSEFSLSHSLTHSHSLFLSVCLFLSVSLVFFIYFHPIRTRRHVCRFCLFHFFFSSFLPRSISLFLSRGIFFFYFLFFFFYHSFLPALSSFSPIRFSCFTVSVSLAAVFSFSFFLFSFLSFFFFPFFATCLRCLFSAGR